MKTCIAWAGAFVICTSFVLGMLLASAYFTAVPDNMGRMMASLGLASIVCGAMTVLEGARGNAST